MSSSSPMSDCFILGDVMKIRLTELRKIIRGVLQEKALLSPEDVEKERMMDLRSTKKKEIFVKAMRQLNLKLIPTDKRTPGMLGEGAYGIVFHVVQDNKHMVMKMTSDSSDSKAYKKVMKIRSEVPGIAQSVLPIIYDQIEVDDYYFTLIEYLVPMPSTLKKSVWHYDGFSGISRSTVAKLNSKFASKLEQYIAETIGPDVLEDILVFNSGKNFNDLKKKITTGKSWAGNHDEYFQSAYKTFEIFFKSVQEVLKPYHLDHGSSIRSFALELSEIWLSLVGKEQLTTTKFPEFHHEEFRNEFDEESEKIDKMSDIKDSRVRKLLLGLRWLYQNDYMSWNDLHYNNVMMRPSTGELVASDVGNFYIR